MDICRRCETFAVLPQGAGHNIVCGDVDAAWEQCAHVVEGRVRVGGQEHFYLEPQGTVVIPGENDEFVIISSTQVLMASLWHQQLALRLLCACLHKKRLPNASHPQNGCGGLLRMSGICETSCWVSATV